MSQSDVLASYLAELKVLKSRTDLLDDYIEHLESCCEALEDDARYKNDLRYLKLWVELITQYTEDDNDAIGVRFM